MQEIEPFSTLVPVVDEPTYTVVPQVAAPGVVAVTGVPPSTVMLQAVEEASMPITELVLALSENGVVSSATSFIVTPVTDRVDAPVALKRIT